MNASQLAAAVIVVVVLTMLIRHACRAGRDRKLRASPPPESWQPILHERFSTVYRLAEIQQKQLFGIMQIFLNRVHFEELRSYYKVNPLDWQG